MLPEQTRALEPGLSVAQVKTLCISVNMLKPETNKAGRGNHSDTQTVSPIKGETPPPKEHRYFSGKTPG